MNIQEVQAKVNQLLGQKAWGVSLGYGSFLTIEFGQPLPSNNEQQKIHGEWHLWLYNCTWRLEEGDKILADSEDKRNNLEVAVHRLENLTLQSVNLIPPAWDMVFAFEHQVVLKLFAIYSQNYNHWFLYTPDAEVLNVKILRILSKLCIGIGDTEFDQLMTLFSIDNGFYLGKTQRL